MIVKFQGDTGNVIRALTPLSADMPSTGAEGTANATKVRVVTILKPGEIVAGDYKIEIVFHLTNGVTKAVDPIPFMFFDGFKQRVIEVSPKSLPTSATVDGRVLKLQNEVQVLVSNIPQDISIQDVSAVLGTVQATVLDVSHLVSCQARVPDCNRCTSLLSPAPSRLLLSIHLSSHPGSLSAIGPCLTGVGTEF